MSFGTYSNIRPADVSLDDIEVLMYYTSSRDNNQNISFIKLDTATI